MIMVYLKLGLFRQISELLAALPEYFIQDQMNKVFYVGQVLEASKRVPGTESLRRALLADVARDYPWALSSLAEPPAGMTINVKNIENSRLISVNGRILITGESDRANVLDHNFEHEDSFELKTGYGAKLFRTSKGLYVIWQKTIKFLENDLKHVPEVVLMAGVSSLGEVSSILETSKGVFVGGEHGFVVLDKDLNPVTGVNYCVGKVSGFLETPRGILVGGELGFVVLNDDLEPAKPPVDLVEGVSGMRSASEGIFISGKAGTRLLNADLTPSESRVFPGQFIGQVKEGFIVYSSDYRFILLDENYKEKWAIGSDVSNVIVKGPDAIEKTYIPSGHFLSPNDLEIRPWGLILHCTRADLFFNLRLDLLMAVPRTSGNMIAVNYQGENFFVSSKYASGADNAESFSQHRDAAKNGGIDLTPEQWRLETTSDGAEMDFTLDPSALQRYQAAPGLEPVIINTMPLDDLQKFLAVQ